jgi:hypothetical protein
MVVVRATGKRGPQAKGHEVWLLAAAPDAGGAPVPWDFIERYGQWEEHAEPQRPFGRCLVSRGGRARVPVGADPELRFMTHPWSGHVEIGYRGRRETFNLYSATGGELIVYPARHPMADAAPAPVAYADNASARPAGRTAAAERFLQQVKSSGATVVAVHCPRWLGVTSSTRVLFDCCYAIPESAEREPYPFDEAEIAYHADVLGESGVQHVVFSGGDELHFRIMNELRKRRPAMRCDLLWHGGYFFFSKDYDWKILRMWIDAARAGDVRVIGTVKKGMEVFFAAAGIESRLVLN